MCPDSGQCVNGSGSDVWNCPCIPSKEASLSLRLLYLILIIKLLKWMEVEQHVEPCDENFMLRVFAELEEPGLQEVQSHYNTPTSPIWRN